MVEILSEKIRDNRFLRLLRNMLRAGYLEDWVFNPRAPTPAAGIQASCRRRAGAGGVDAPAVPGGVADGVQETAPDLRSPPGGTSPCPAGQLTGGAADAGVISALGGRSPPAR